MSKDDTMMENYNKSREYQCLTKVVHGVGVLNTLPATVRGLGIKKPLIVTGPNVAAAGHLDQVTEKLKQAGISCAIFDQVVPNPDIQTVGQGSKVYIDAQCDGLIGLGGGSAMDTAKAIGVEVTHEGNILYWEAVVRELENRIPPLITIPTTAGTGSEITVWSVITDPDRRFKFNVGGMLLSPYVAIIDPLLHISMPPEVTAGTGMDALCHAIECFTCHYAQPHTDAVALLAIEYCSQYLRRAVGDAKDMEARYYMAMAANLAGMAYGTESAGAVHAMAHTLGGIKPEIQHGPAVASMLAPSMEYNWIGRPERFRRVAEALGVNTAGLSEREACLKGAQAVYNLADDLGIPSLQELGVRCEEIPMLAREAQKDPQTQGNPRDINIEGYEWIYRRCLGMIE